MAVVSEAKIWPLRAPLQTPIRVSFGQMTHRPGLLISLRDAVGNIGWGESWTNYPQWAPYERTMVLSHLLRDIVGKEVYPRDVEGMYQKYLPIAIQWGGIGPFSQALSAIESALWDLEAKQQRRPLFQVLNGTAALQGKPSIAVYGSGIGPDELETRVERALQTGFHDVKVKIGFDAERDRDHFTTARHLVGKGNVMVDANQAWTRETARREISYYQSAGAHWVEEPISALDWEGYRDLTAESPILAAGENWYLPSVEDVGLLPLRVVQPDLCKIGGVWAARIMTANIHKGSRVAFHVLGLPLCHALALHTAAAWGDKVTYVEFDTNENPLSETMQTAWRVDSGRSYWTEGVGLGIEVDVEQLERFVIPELKPFCLIQ